MASTTNYIDLQVNGYVGVDFNDPTISIDQLKAAAIAMRKDGVASALPTVITANLDVMSRCIQNIVQSIRNDADCAEVFQGLHIEGPFISREKGYIGAHPPEHALAASSQALSRLLDAADGLARLLTLAPEIDRDGSLTLQCVERGCVVAAGHTDASLDDLARCLDAGLTLFTHLGNGCPRLMDRHDNIIYRALRCDERLCYTLIADSFHVPQLLFKNLLDWVDIGRLCVVSDAISATGLGPGEYRLGGRSVKIGIDKAARNASGEHFVGAASSLRDADNWLEHHLGLDPATRQQLLVDNPRKFCHL